MRFREMSDEQVALAITLVVQRQMWREAAVAGGASRGGGLDLTWADAGAAYARLLREVQRWPAPMHRHRIASARRNAVTSLRLKAALGDAAGWVAALPPEVAERCIVWVKSEAEEDALVRRYVLEGRAAIMAGPGPGAGASGVGEAPRSPEAS